jgi:hypothetical protein
MPDVAASVAWSWPGVKRCERSGVASHLHRYLVNQLLMSRRERSRTGPRPRAVAELEQLYAQLPRLACRGLCGDSCAEHVDAGPLERRRISQRGVDLDAPTADGACPALSHALGAGFCSVYEVRPMACRLWGVAASMPCPHGCLPEGGRVSDATMLRWMLESLELGGRPNQALRQLLERCLADPRATALMGRMLRGDRSVANELAAQLTARESTTGKSVDR